jgi:hypothetical protein
MHQPASLQQLTDRIVYLEKKVDLIHKELTDLRQEQTVPQTIATSSAITYPWVDKEILKRRMETLFKTLSIQRKPIGALALQEQMSQIGLNPDELSRGIIEAREE